MCGTLTGGQTLEMRAGDLITIPAGVPHQMILAPGTHLRFVVIKNRSDGDTTRPAIGKPQDTAVRPQIGRSPFLRVGMKPYRMTISQSAKDANRRAFPCTVV
jgi:uncharacterized protein YjlB